MSASGDGPDDASDDGIDSFLREAGRIPSLPVEVDRIGQQLGRFRIDAKLGQGGMGIVYAAEDVELGRRVALKVLPHAAVADDERRRRFLREARTAATVIHPNLAAVFEVGEAAGTVYLAMELVAGASLRARIDAAPRGMRAAEAVGIALQIARGLGKAHASGVVHRDLKPENVMMDPVGHAKVVDFGLAKLSAPDSSRAAESDLSTQDGRILGTPSYMAPEQAKGSRVGPAADVFSLGVVLYEMLTGVRPFGGSSLVEVLVATARDTPDAPSRKAPHIARELDRLVLRCLAKDPAARFRDGDTVAAALEELRATGPRRPATWLAVSGMVVATSALLLLSMRWTRTAAPRPGASSPVELAGDPPRASATPSGERAAEPNATGERHAAEPNATGERHAAEPSATGELRADDAGVAAPRAVAFRPAAPARSAAPPAPTSTAAPRSSVDPLARQK